VRKKKSGDGSTMAESALDGERETAKSSLEADVNQATIKHSLKPHVCA